MFLFSLLNVLKIKICVTQLLYLDRKLKNAPATQKFYLYFSLIWQNIKQLLSKPKKICNISQSWWYKIRCTRSEDGRHDILVIQKKVHKKWRCILILCKIQRCCLVKNVFQILWYTSTHIKYILSLYINNELCPPFYY